MGSVHDLVEDLDQVYTKDVATPRDGTAHEHPPCSGSELEPTMVSL